MLFWSAKYEKWVVGRRGSRMGVRAENGFKGVGLGLRRVSRTRDREFGRVVWGGKGFKGEG